MPAIQCFMLEPTNRVRRWLRRYHSTPGSAPEEEKCQHPGNFGYHDAEVQIEDGPCIDRGDGTWDTDPMQWPHTDKRWPKNCACGYKFKKSDEWQLQYHRLYTRADNGEECTLRDAPAGAMYYADWISPREDAPGPGTYRGPDGHCLAVVIPGGMDGSNREGHAWIADGPASNGPGWTRTGTPPNVTATPSIGRQDDKGGWLYHGWLRDGVLTDA